MPTATSRMSSLPPLDLSDRQGRCRQGRCSQGRAMPDVAPSPPTPSSTTFSKRDISWVVSSSSQLPRSRSKNHRYGRLNIIVATISDDRTRDGIERRFGRGPGKRQ
jgi:hypothetical protein